MRLSDSQSMLPSHLELLSKALSAEKLASAWPSKQAPEPTSPTAADGLFNLLSGGAKRSPSVDSLGGVWPVTAAATTPATTGNAASELLRAALQQAGVGPMRRTSSLEAQGPGNLLSALGGVSGSGRSSLLSSPLADLLVQQSLAQPSTGDLLAALLQQQRRQDDAAAHRMLLNKAGSLGLESLLVKHEHDFAAVKPAQQVAYTLKPEPVIMECPPAHLRQKGKVYMVRGSIKRWDGKRFARCCEVKTCTKLAQGPTSFCKSHGGGTRCKVETCQKAARGGFLYCLEHGGLGESDNESTSSLGKRTRSTEAVEAEAEAEARSCKAPRASDDEPTPASSPAADA